MFQYAPGSSKNRSTAIAGARLAANELTGERLERLDRAQTPYSLVSHKAERRRELDRKDSSQLFNPM
jgi:hypothetical protein